MEYFSTFTSGADKIIHNCLKKYVKDAYEIFLSNDLVVYNTDSKIDAVKNLQFFNNTFVLLYWAQKNFTIEELVQKTLSEPSFIEKVTGFVGDQKLTYRIMFSKNNTTVAIPDDLRNQLEKKINSVTKLSVHRTLPKIEIWFHEKREGYGIIGIRITKKPDYQAFSFQGELRQEVSFLLNFVAEVNKSDTILDPFCGSGSIGISCAKNFRYSAIYNSDLDVSKINDRISEYRFRDFHIEQSDFRDLEIIGITKVITDPPWGVSENVDIPELYGDFFKMFANIKTIVILTSQYETAVEQSKKSGFGLDADHKIYVGGQESYIMKFVSRR